MNDLGGTRLRDFKSKVLAWLSENNIPVKKARVYNTRRYGMEVRIYHGTTSFPNTKRSRRMWKEADADGNNCTFGYHSRDITLYTAINEETFDSKEEMEYTLRCLRDNI